MRPTIYGVVLAIGSFVANGALLAQDAPATPDPAPQAIRPPYPAGRSPLALRRDGADPRVAVRFAQGQALARIGVTVSRASPAIASQLNLRPNSGLVVESVVPGSPAEQAGIQQYDVIERLDNQPLANPMQLDRSGRSNPAGGQLNLSVIREGKRMRIVLRLDDLAGQSRQGMTRFRPGAGAQYPMSPMPPMPSQPRYLDAAPPTPSAEPRNRLSDGQDGNDDGRIESREQATITITRDNNGQRTMTVRDSRGRIIFRQSLNGKQPSPRSDSTVRDGLTLKLPSPELQELNRIKDQIRKELDQQLRQLDQLKAQLRQQAEQIRREAQQQRDQLLRQFRSQLRQNRDDGDNDRN